MKTFQKGLMLLVISMILGTMAFAQTKSISQKADELFEQKRFIEAYDKYEEAYNKVSGNKAEKNRVYFQMGECKRLMYQFDRAKSIYKRLAASKYYTTEPKLYFYLAEMCRFIGTPDNFDEAEEFYTKYLELVPDDAYAKSRKESLIFVNQLVNNKTRHVIIRKDEWSTNYNDWAPRFVGDDTNTIVFTSSRMGAGDEKQSTDVWTGEALSDIYKVFQDRKGNWTTTPELFDDKGIINTPDNEGQPCFSPDGKTIYFTRCESRENQTLGCAIFTSVKVNPAMDGEKKSSKKKKDPNADLNAQWDVPELIHLGDTEYNYLYPAISRDGLTLYFTSDMPGGYGGYDLWVARRKSVADEFGVPRNLGPKINTAGREVYPTLQGDTIMYFSSDGHPGLGGLDLFKTQLEGSRFSTPVNMGYPINTSRDEMSLFFYPPTEHYMLERGFFSSNRDVPYPHEQRPETKGKKFPAPNDDIYYFELPPLLYTIEGTIRDEKSMQLVEHAKVRIVGSNGTEYETYTDKKGFYRFDEKQILRNTIYKMYVSKVDYFTLEGSESTCGYTTNKDIVHDFRIEPVPKQPVVLPEIRYDLAKWDLKEEFMDSLMDLYLVMENNPNIVVEIRAHTDCRPFIGLTNDTLSQRRAQSVVDYLVSRGIERDRLVAKGYAERVPRTLDRDMRVKVNGHTYTFAEGTTLECDYVNRLPNKEHQEAAHQLNRRIEFLILRTDFVSKRLIDNMASETPIAKRTEDGKVIDLVNKPIEQVETAPDIVHDESTIPVSMIHSAKGEISAIINGSQIPVLIDERYIERIAISWEEAMNFLYQRRINKEDFPDRDNAFDPEGNILDKATIIFKEMQIGQKHVKNVEVVVVKGVDYKFIINREGLGLFGNYEFDKQRGKLIFLDD
ncbi:MAG: OmpA family protein [Bacteroidales bacterium]|nr:OmpA family protein [Bacteroidales bacterium]